ncbi:MAG: serine hydroxymethyltransferase [Rickettsiales bacterium]
MLANKTKTEIYQEIKTHDPEIYNSIMQEYDRQQNSIELIASENYVSQAVMEAQGSILTNKYAEGYPARRYYGGCEFVDIAENLAIDRLKKLYGVNFANVQPHSGSQANQAVFLALLQPGDTFLGMSLDAGGHLTHGSKVNLSGKWFNPINYGVRKEDGYIDMDQVAQLAAEHKPKLIIAGGSAYPRKIDFQAFRKIADSVGAYFMVDMAHFSGLVAGNAFPSPVRHAHVITSTTHKTLRGPRGGIILTNEEELAKKINSAIFPGLQGGPLMHVIAAKAIAFGEALRADYQVYAKQVIANCQTLASTLISRGYELFTGGTDCHLLLVDLRKQGLKGNAAEKSLERAGLTCNKNSIPFDTEKPAITSGIRLGSAAGTTRGFKHAEFVIIGNLIADVLDAMINNPEGNTDTEQKTYKEVKKLCDKFLVY